MSTAAIAIEYTPGRPRLRMAATMAAHVPATLRASDPTTTGGQHVLDEGNAGTGGIGEPKTGDPGRPQLDHPHGGGRPGQCSIGLGGFGGHGVGGHVEGVDTHVEGAHTVQRRPFRT